jgi:hypothetical protein
VNRVLTLLALFFLGIVAHSQQYSRISSLLPLRKIYRGDILSPVPPYIRLDRLGENGIIQERFTGFFQERDQRLVPVSYTRLHADSYFSDFLLSSQYQNGQLQKIFFGSWGEEKSWETQWEGPRIQGLSINRKDESQIHITYQYSDVLLPFPFLPSRVDLRTTIRGKTSFIGSLSLSQRELMSDLYQISIVPQGVIFTSDSEHYFYDGRGKLLSFEKWQKGELTEVEYQYDEQGLLFREIVKHKGVKDIYSYFYESDGKTIKLYVVKGLQDEAKLTRRYQFPSQASLVHLSQILSPVTNYPFYLPAATSAGE